MFQSLPLKTQAKRLGDIFSQHGVSLTRAQKLEALAHIHGASNWQTLRTTDQQVFGAVPPAAVEPASKQVSEPPAASLIREGVAYGEFADAPFVPHADGLWTHVEGGSGCPFPTLSEQTERQVCDSILRGPLLPGEVPQNSVWAHHRDGRRRLMALRLHDTPAQVPGLSVYPIQSDSRAHPVSQWRLQHDLSHSSGGFNRAQLERKPYLGQGSQFSVEQWNRCLDLLNFGEGSYIGCLDGVLGVYFEQEYMTQESETEEGEDPVNFPTYVERVRQLQCTHGPLVAKYPEFSFAVSNEPELTWNGRPCLWAFMPASTATIERSRELASDLYELAYPQG